MLTHTYIFITIQANYKVTYIYIYIYVTIHYSTLHFTGTLQYRYIYIIVHYSTDTFFYYTTGRLNIYGTLHFILQPPYTIWIHFFLQYNTIHYITGRFIHTAIYIHRYRYITLQDALIHSLRYISYTHTRTILSFFFP